MILIFYGSVQEIKRFPFVPSAIQEMRHNDDFYLEKKKRIRFASDGRARLDESMGARCLATSKEKAKKRKRRYEQIRFAAERRPSARPLAMRKSSEGHQFNGGR